jgi:hypothetical protein
MRVLGSIYNLIRKNKSINKIIIKNTNKFKLAYQTQIV